MIAWPWQRRVHVAEIGRDEAPILSEIHAAAFARTWSEHEFAALLAERNVFALGARVGARLAGFVLVRMAADEAEILTIAVCPGDRRRGYGRLLMEEALRRLYRSGIAACFLEVERGNAAATGLYRALGYVVTGERKHYYQGGSSGDGAALVMRVQVR